MLKVTELFSKAILLTMFVYGDGMAVCVTCALGVGKQVQRVNNLINKTPTTGTETITPGEGTKGSDIYRAGNQGGDGVQVSVFRC